MRDKPLEIIYESMVEDPNSLYWESLNTYLGQFNMYIGENEWNKTGVVDEEQKGIYHDDIQIGKIDRRIENGELILEHISSKYKGFRLVSKIYPHDEKFASDRGYSVSSSLVNDYTMEHFLRIFTPDKWEIEKIDNITLKASKKAK